MKFQTEPKFPRTSSRVGILIYFIVLIAFFGLISWFGASLYLASIWNPLSIQQATYIEGLFPKKLGMLTPVKVSPVLSGCSGALFTISDDAAKNILAGGLDYYKDAAQGRLVSQNLNSETYIWNATPIPNTWDQEGQLTSGFQSIQLAENLAHQINVAAHKAGGYYSISSKDEHLLVLPNLGLVLFGSCD